VLDNLWFSYRYFDTKSEPDIFKLEQ
jgi:hypothetical protein